MRWIYEKKKPKPRDKKHSHDGPDCDAADCESVANCCGRGEGTNLY